ncbi:MAG: hypothetical protein K2X48_16530 [Chitinophagaceae bacterium]|nr:hypothetical protein [Chitinophagaceae bacterium]
MALLVIYPLYKLVREIIWVKKENYFIENKLKIRIRTDETIIAFQDPLIDNEIQIKNVNTGRELTISIESPESELFFYLDSTKQETILILADKFAGINKYELKNLALIGENCFEDIGVCGGCNDSCIQILGTPVLKVN